MAVPDQMERRRRKHEAYLARERRSRLRRNFGLTWEEYQAILEAQGGGCAVCQALPPENRLLPVDHDPVTGKVRGLLCDSCNTAIGLLKDDPGRLQSAIDYLTRGQHDLRANQRNKEAGEG